MKTRSPMRGGKLYLRPSNGVGGGRGDTQSSDSRSDAIQEVPSRPSCMTEAGMGSHWEWV
jgi:hypothetical protein